MDINVLGNFIYDNLAKIIGLLILLFGGGIIYRFWDRPRLNITFYKLGLREKGLLVFEAENYGNMPTSLKPIVKLKGFIPKEMSKKKIYRFQRSSYNYFIETSDRSLPSNTPKRFQAKSNDDDICRPFLWYMTYTFTLTRGRKKWIRVRSIHGEILSLRKFVSELVWYQLTGKLSFPKAKNK